MRGFLFTTESMVGITITSSQNPRIKRFLNLQQKSSERRKAALFVVEGLREMQHCVQAGFTIDSVYYCKELLQPNALPALLAQAGFTTAEACSADGQRLCRVSPDVYAKMAYRGGTEGVMAIVRWKPTTLSDLQLPEKPLIVVLESVEKPGNLGAVLRTADAANADAIIVCDPLTDLYNPNLIRSSIGAIFTVPCVATTSEACIAFLKQHNINILTAQLQDSYLYYDTDMTQATALVMGTEATGLTDQWRQAANAHIRIPMRGRLDSLNVSVSTAILLFEAVRQRLCS